MNSESNVISHNFDHEVKFDVLDLIKKYGRSATLSALLNAGFHESVARALIRQALKAGGW